MLIYDLYLFKHYFSDKFSKQISDTPLFDKMREMIPSVEEVIFDYSKKLYQKIDAENEKNKEIVPDEQTSDELCERILSCLQDLALNYGSSINKRLSEYFIKFNLTSQERASINRFMNFLDKLLEPEVFLSLGRSVRNKIHGLLYGQYNNGYLPRLNESISSEALSRLLLQLPWSSSLLKLMSYGYLPTELALKYHASGRITENTQFLFNEAGAFACIVEAHKVMHYTHANGILKKILSNDSINPDDGELYLKAAILYKIIEKEYNNIYPSWNLNEIGLFIEDLAVKNISKELRLSLNKLEQAAKTESQETIGSQYAQRQLFLLLKNFASQGSIYAQCTLSLLCSDNRGIDYSGVLDSAKMSFRYEQAFHWAKSAALSGSVPAAIRLAQLFEANLGIPLVEYGSLVDQREKFLYESQQIFHWRRVAATKTPQPAIQYWISQCYEKDYEGIPAAERNQYGKTSQNWREHRINQAYFWCRKAAHYGHEKAKERLTLYYKILKKSDPRIITDTALQAAELIQCFLPLKDFISLARSCKNALMVARNNMQYWSYILNDIDPSYHHFKIVDRTLKSKHYNVVRSFAKRAINLKAYLSMKKRIHDLKDMSVKEKIQAICDINTQVIFCSICGEMDRPIYHLKTTAAYYGWEHMSCNNCIPHKLWSKSEAVVIWGFSHQQLSSVPCWNIGGKAVYSTEDLLDFFLKESIEARTLTCEIITEYGYAILDRLSDLPPVVRNIIKFLSEPSIDIKATLKPTTLSIDSSPLDDKSKNLASPKPFLLFSRSPESLQTWSPSTPVSLSSISSKPSESIVKILKDKENPEEEETIEEVDDEQDLNYLEYYRPLKQILKIDNVMLRTETGEIFSSIPKPTTIQAEKIEVTVTHSYKPGKLTIMEPLTVTINAKRASHIDKLQTAETNTTEAPGKVQSLAAEKLPEKGQPKLATTDSSKRKKKKIKKKKEKKFS